MFCETTFLTINCRRFSSGNDIVVISWESRNLLSLSQCFTVEASGAGLVAGCVLGNYGVFYT